jgi:hypothetical protein
VERLHWVRAPRRMLDGARGMHDAVRQDASAEPSRQESGMISICCDKNTADPRSDTTCQQLLLRIIMWTEAARQHNNNNNNGRRGQTRLEGGREGASRATSHAN